MTLLKKELREDSFAEFRQSPVTKRWVLVNPGRSKRPEEYSQKNKTRESKSDISTCPFCVGNEAKYTPDSSLELFDQGELKKWVVRVIPNKYPAVIKQDTNAKSQEVDQFHVHQSATGYHEVIVTREHERHVAELPISDIDAMLHSYQLRIKEIAKDTTIQYVLIFQNRGDEAGASVVHPHSQLIALNHVPDHPEAELNNMGEYFDMHGSPLMADILTEEIERDERIVMQSDHFIIYAPYASPFPFQVWLMPKESLSRFELLSGDLRLELAELLKKYLGRLDERLDEPAYNYYLHTLPVNGRYASYEKQYHWHMTIFPRLNIWAGFEYGSGVAINEMPPEKATEFLK